MGKIYCLMGKSSSGKDSLFKILLEDSDLPLKTIVPYTTRPKREGEREGVEYYFCTEEKVQRLQAAGKIIEVRAYNTIHGIWKYMTVDDEQIQLDQNSYLYITTLEGYIKLREYFGEEIVIPVYVEVEDGLRLKRALMREQAQKKPKYEEMCRRFLADAADFAEDKLMEGGITKRFTNDNLEDTAQVIKEYIKSTMH